MHMQQHVSAHAQQLKLMFLVAACKPDVSHHPSTSWCLSTSCQAEHKHQQGSHAELWHCAALHHGLVLLQNWAQMETDYRQVQEECQELQSVLEQRDDQLCTLNQDLLDLTVRMKVRQLLVVMTGSILTMA